MGSLFRPPKRYPAVFQQPTRPPQAAVRVNNRTAPTILARFYRIPARQVESLPSASETARILSQWSKLREEQTRRFDQQASRFDEYARKLEEKARNLGERENRIQEMLNEEHKILDEKRKYLDERLNKQQEILDARQRRMDEQRERLDRKLDAQEGILAEYLWQKIQGLKGADKFNLCGALEYIVEQAPRIVQIPTSLPVQETLNRIMGLPEFQFLFAQELDRQHVPRNQAEGSLRTLYETVSVRASGNENPILVKAKDYKSSERVGIVTLLRLQRQWGLALEWKEVPDGGLRGAEGGRPYSV